MDTMTQNQVDLLKALRPGDTVYTKLEHVSRSGMTRSISVWLRGKDGGWTNVTEGAAEITGYRIDRYDGLKVGGCGMDMGFHVVYGLSRRLYPDGWKCTGHDGTKRANRCPSNDHTNGAPYGRGRKHRDGGYYLNHSWTNLQW